MNDIKYQLEQSETDAFNELKKIIEKCPCYKMHDEFVKMYDEDNSLVLKLINAYKKVLKDNSLDVGLAWKFAFTWDEMFDKHFGTMSYILITRYSCNTTDITTFCDIIFPDRVIISKDYCVVKEIRDYDIVGIL